jgi:hypothetical protein
MRNAPRVAVAAIALSVGMQLGACSKEAEEPFIASETL